MTWGEPIFYWKFKNYVPIVLPMNTGSIIVHTYLRNAPITTVSTTCNLIRYWCVLSSTQHAYNAKYVAIKKETMTLATLNLQDSWDYSSFNLHILACGRQSPTYIHKKNYKTTIGLLQWVWTDCLRMLQIFLYTGLKETMPKEAREKVQHQMKTTTDNLTADEQTYINPNQFDKY